jgi:hypothetical protein
VLLAQPQNAEAGAVALFRVAFGRDDALKQISSWGEGQPKSPKTKPTTEHLPRK